MKRRLWYTVLVLQIIGLLCLSGGESFAITRLGVVCRLIALVVLEPGLLVMEVISEKIFWGSPLTVAQIYWLGVIFGIAMNVLIAALVFRFVGNWRQRKLN
jgi:hypothetical protein